MVSILTRLQPAAVCIRIHTFLTLAILAFCSGCGGGGGGGGPIPPSPPPDIRGVWAGTWTGNSATQGLVTGTWEAELDSQLHSHDPIYPDLLYYRLDPAGVPPVSYFSKTKISGTGSLRGDIDCMDGSLEGLVDAQNIDASILHQIVGWFRRTGCKENYWQLTALDLSDGTAGGLWSQRSSGDAGTFTGTRIAGLNGPRIRYFSPPSGKQGALVTITGDNFSPSLSDNALAFDKDLTPVLAATTSTLITKVPSGVTSGPVGLSTPAGSATGPVAFIRDVTFPALISPSTITTSSTPEGIAVSPNGRNIYLAHTNSRISLINSTHDIVLATSSLPGAKNLVASPDGRWIYATTVSNRIRVLDAARLIANTADEIAVNVGGVPVLLGSAIGQTPNGLAISPDGRYLYATQNEDAGAVVVIDIATKAVVTTVSKGAGATPVGVAMHPDGQSAYFAYSGYGIVAYDIQTMTASDVVGPNLSPSGLLVTPDGTKLYVSDTLANSVDVYNVGTNTWIKSIPVGLAPMGIAISPDGSRVYVANNSSNTVSVIRVVGDAVVDAPISVGTLPVSIAITPTGRLGYVTNRGSSNVSSIGGSLTLTTAKKGSGTGTLNSTPGGIYCGTICQSKFSPSTLVKLTAAAGSGSTFQGWTGDADCSDGEVTINTNTSCTAEFRAIPRSSGGSGVDGSSCFIATAAYGSVMASDVVLLRKFRDKHLLTNAFGEAFVELYYQHSPPFASYLTRHEHMRTAVRWGLQPIVMMIKYPGTGPALGGILICTFFGMRMSRSRRSSRATGSHDGARKRL